MAVSIRYWDREPWVGYLRNDVLPLFKSTLTVLGLWRELREVAHGRLLSDVIKGIPSLELVFVGGTSPPDRYEEGSLALIYRYLLGTSIKLREYYFLKQHGKEPKTPCTVERTRVVDYIDHVHTLLERAVARALELGLLAQDDIQKIQESSVEAIRETIARPERISEIFVELLNRALGITVARNEFTRFIWHLHKIPKKYIAELYPGLLKPEVFEFVQRCLGLSEYIVPQVEDPEIRDLYTIYSFDHATEALVYYHDRTTGLAHGRIDSLDGIVIEEYLADKPPPSYEPYKTVGGCLCRVNELIWELFRLRDYLRLVATSEVPDPLEEWKKMVKNGPPTLWKLNYLSSYEDLSILDEQLPAVLTGRAELVIEVRGRALYVFRRW